MERGEGGVMESNELTKASFREAQNRPMGAGLWKN